MKQKHTPGLWAIDASLTPKMFIDGTDCDGARETVAEIYTDTDVSPDTIKANARLIAAAPELLAWVQFALDTWTMDDNSRDGLRAVIAKATGGSNE